jgi:hypothetical protein
MTSPPDDTGDHRRALHAYLSDEAHETWHDVAGRLGCSVSAMLETMTTTLPDEDPDGSLANVVKQARRIDAERRRR